MKLFIILKVIFLPLVMAKLPFASSDSVTYTGDKSPSPGKDYQTLLALQHKYPLVYIQRYASLDYTLQQIQRTPRLRAHTQIFKLKAEKESFEKIFAEFEKDLNQWRINVEKKLDFGLYGPEKRSFFVKITTYLKKTLPTLKAANRLAAFHQYLNKIDVPRFEGLSFEDRFLKPKYADAYRLRKIDFYQHLLDEANLLPLADPNCALLIQLYHEKKEAWRTRPLPQTINQTNVLPMDELTGITTLQNMGYKGKGTEIGVIEPINPKESINQIHEDLKKNLLQNQSLMSLHGAHVSGIVGAKAQTIYDRLGIAPKAKILFRAMTTNSQGTTIYYDRSANSMERKIIHSKPSETADKELGSLLNDLTHKNIRLINASFVFSFGLNSLKAFWDFTQKGGVLIKAAGNAGLPLQKDPIAEGTLSNTHRLQVGIDSGFYSTLRHNPTLMKHVLIVGNLKNATTLEPSSNQAGDFKDRFISAWGTDVASTTTPYTREKMTGTSMAAPMVTGALSLLMEAFPTCDVPTLSQGLLDSAAPLPFPEKTGKGRLDLTAAFTLLETICGKAVSPLRKKT